MEDPGGTSLISQRLGYTSICLLSAFYRSFNAVLRMLEMMWHAQRDTKIPYGLPFGGMKKWFTPWPIIGVFTGILSYFIHYQWWTTGGIIHMVKLGAVGTCWNMLEHVGTCWNMLEHVGTCWNHICCFPIHPQNDPQWLVLLVVGCWTATTDQLLLYGILGMDNYNHLTDTFKDIVVIVHFKKLRRHIWINTPRNMD